MAESIESHPKLQRCLALAVSFWAYNMTVVHDRGQSAPGFGYTDGEQETLRTIARKISLAQFIAWLALTTVFFIVIMAGLLGTLYFVLNALGETVDPATQPEMVSYVQMASVIVVCLSVGFPLAMVAASTLVGRWTTLAAVELADRATTLHFFDKMVFQIARIAIIGALADLVLALVVPGDSRFWLLPKLVLPLLSPAIAVFTLAYYASARLRRG
jgi:hypothetical protein